MATTLEIMGRSFEIAPYKLGALRRAAPHIDAVNRAAREVFAGTEKAEAEIAERVKAGESEDSVRQEVMLRHSFTEFLGPIDHIAAIVAIGLQKIDPALSADYLLDNLDTSDMPQLAAAMRDILRESGTRSSGEVTAPSAQDAAEGASSSN